MPRALPTLVLPALALLPACAATTAAPPRAGGDGADTCAHEALAGFVGQRASAALGAEMLAASGARTLRWAPPRSALTMDFRADRLTISYDDDLLITGARCG